MLDTSAYEDFFSYSDTIQIPLTKQELAALEQSACGILSLDQALIEREVWGDLQPPGRYAYVIHVRRRFMDLIPTLSARCSIQGISEVGLKIYKDDAADIVKFQSSRAENGTPHQYSQRIQRVIYAGEWLDQNGKLHHYMILEFVSGVTLEEKRARYWTKAEPLHSALARQLLADLLQILLEILAETRQGSAMPWDLRDANLVVTPDNRLVSIDSCSLYPGKSKNRRGQQKGLLARFRNIAARVLSAWNGRSSNYNLKKRVNCSWKASGLEAALDSLGNLDHPEPADIEVAQKHIAIFLNRALREQEE